jgi:hypothetical protein
MDIEFYNVKTRSKVAVSEDKVQRTTFKKTNKDGSLQVRYAVKANVDGMSLMKFVSQKDWEKMTAPIIESAK